MGAVLAAAMLPAMATLIAGCGGTPTSTTSAPTTSKVAKRVLVSNEFVQRLEIVNAATDAQSGSFITTASTTGRMVVAGGLTLTYSPIIGAVTTIDNAKEAVAQNILLPGIAEDVALSSDAVTGYAAVRNSGMVVAFDPKVGTTTNINIPTPRKLVLNSDNSKLLVFSDDTSVMSVIKTSDKTVQTLAGLDHPVNAVFTDANRALVLSCGPECGGAAAAVTAIDLSGATPVLGASVAVSAATVGLLDSGNLYVAGNSSAGGRLDVINATTLAVVKSGVVISGGYHYLMALAGTKLYVGAKTCSVCLSIYNTTATTAVIGGANGEVTGLQPITGRTVVYVVEGGELRIYDTGTDAVQTKQIDIVGKAVDAKLIDP